MKKMKMMFFAVAMGLASLMPAGAQTVERMSCRLMLDEATTAKFTPIYQAYLQELQDCRKDCPYAAVCESAKPGCKNVQPGCRNKKAGCKGYRAHCVTANMSDAELEKFMEQRFERQQKKLNIQKKYYKELKGILNARQLHQLFFHNGPKGGFHHGMKACPQAGKRCMK